MASIEVNVHVQTICHSRRRANAYWCSFFIECRWQRCLGRVKGASWGSSKNGMIETWDITYEVYLSGNYMKDFEFDSIHSSETTKINSVGKRASFVSIWYRPLVLRTIVTCWLHFIYTKRFFVISHSLPFNIFVCLFTHIARVSSYTAASNIMYSSWATLANKMISLWDDIDLCSGTPRSAPAQLKLIRTHTRWQYWHCMRWINWRW